MEKLPETKSHTCEASARAKDKPLVLATASAGELSAMCAGFGKIVDALPTIEDGEAVAGKTE